MNGLWTCAAPATPPRPWHRTVTIYFGTFRGKFWAVNPDGSPKWTFLARNEIKSAPAVGSDGTIYFGSRDGNLYALSPDGRKRWEQEVF